jgi:hypothetical protein
MGLFKMFKGGDLVPTSGLYAALHSTAHKLVESVTYVEGDRFQRCRLCPLGVLYRLEKPDIPVSSTTVSSTTEGELTAA